MGTNNTREILSQIEDRFHAATGAHLEELNAVYAELAQMVEHLSYCNEGLGDKARRSAMAAASMLKLREAIRAMPLHQRTDAIARALSDTPDWEQQDLMRDLSWALDELGSLGLHRERLQVIAARYDIPVMLRANPLDLDGVREELAEASKNAPVSDDLSKCTECPDTVIGPGAEKDFGPPAHVLEVLEQALDALADAGIHTADVGVNLITDEDGEYTVELFLPKNAGVVSALRELTR